MLNCVCVCACPQAHRAALPHLPSQVAALVPKDEVHKAMQALKEVRPACLVLPPE